MTPIPFLPTSYAPDWDNEIAARPATVEELTRAVYGEGLPGWNVEDGTTHSPIISGGEVLYLDAYTSTLQEDELPF